jgi:hypothetical protein
LTWFIIFRPFHQIILSSGLNIDWRAFMAFRKIIFSCLNQTCLAPFLKQPCMAYKVKKSGLQTRP